MTRYCWAEIDPSSQQNTKIDYTGMADTSFEYDLVGRRTKMIDASGTTQWFYNSDGELFKMTSPQGEVQYVYSDAGELTTLKNMQAGGSSLDTVYAYTASTGRLESITSPWNEVTTFAYDGQGRLSQKTLPNGLREEISYDSSDRLDTLHIRNVSTNAILRSESYAYDSRGNVTLHNLGGVQTTYGYDPLGQLTSESRTGYSATYTYDGNGNRLTRSRTSGGVTHNDVYNYDQGDKLLSITRNGASFRSYVYDEQGNTTSITESGQVRTFSWNQDNRLTSINLPGTTADPSYAYNGAGTRVSRTLPGATQSWKRAGAGVTASVLNDGTNLYNPGISSRSGGVSTYVHAGMKNTTAQSVGVTLAGTKQYDAFGLEVSATGTWQTAFGYAGNFGYQETDAGLMLLGNRYYDAETGRFLTRDPIKDGRNWYGYCDNSSTMYADFDGRAKVLVICRELQQFKNGCHVDIVVETGKNEWTKFGGGPMIDPPNAEALWGPVWGRKEIMEEEEYRKNNTVVSEVVVLWDNSPPQTWVGELDRIKKLLNYSQVQYDPIAALGGTNSNGYAGEMLKRAALLSSFEKAMEKRRDNGHQPPWLPGFGTWPGKL